MALTRRESVKLLGASLLASGVTAASAKKADARPSRRSEPTRPVPPRQQSPVSMKRLYALPVLLDY
jgi:hypothetical protein